MRAENLLVSAKKERVLMFVKTYPTPSRAYGELVCTAGVRLSDKQWIRIYPYPFRLLDKDRQFRKGDVLVAKLLRTTQDPRPDSYKLYDSAGIAIDSDAYVDIGGRLQLAEATAVDGVREFQQLMLPEGGWGPSLRPVRVKVGSVEVSWKQESKKWPKGQMQKLQLAKDRAESGLFERQEFFRLLEKLPYSFYMSFEDGARDRHRLQILDWEIAVLYLKLVRDNPEAKALELVKQKIEQGMFGSGGTGFVIVGSVRHHYRQPSGIAINCLLPDTKNRLNDGNQRLFD